MPTATSRLTRPNDCWCAGSGPSLAFHGECLFQNPRSCLGQLVFRQLLFARESDVGDIASRVGFTRNAFTQIVNDYVMEPRTLLPVVRARGAVIVNSIEHFD